MPTNNDLLITVPSGSEEGGPDGKEAECCRGAAGSDARPIEASTPPRQGRLRRIGKQTAALNSRAGPASAAYGQSVAVMGTIDAVAGDTTVALYKRAVDSATRTSSTPPCR
jgi:hypothetical protein